MIDNLDDLDRLERLVTREQGVLVRITPGVEGDTHASISTGGSPWCSHATASTGRSYGGRPTTT